MQQLKLQKDVPRLPARHCGLDVGSIVALVILMRVVFVLMNYNGIISLLVVIPRTLG